MPKPWSEIANDPEYQALPANDKAVLRQRYFQNVMSKDPEFLGLPPSDRQHIQAAFLGANPVATDDQHYGLKEMAGDMVKNAPKSAEKFLGNTWSAVTHPIDTAKQVAKIAIGAPLTLGENVGAALAGGSAMDPEIHAALAKQHPHLQAAADTANAVGKDYVNHYGSANAIKHTIGEDPIRAATDLASILTLTPADSAVTAGVNALRAASPTAGRLANLGVEAAKTVGNPLRVLNPAAHAAGRGVRAVANAINPEARMVLEATEGRGPTIARVLGRPNEIVPGSVPTAAQAASPSDVTRFAALGDAAANRFPTEARTIQANQNAARLQHIRSVVPHPNLPAAEQARAINAARDYAAAGIPSDDPALAAMFPAATVMHTADPTLVDLFSHPSVRKAIARATEGMADRGESFQVGHNLPARTVPSSVIGPNGQPVMVNLPPEFAQHSAASLHRLKMAMDDMIKDPAQFGIGASEVNGVRDLRNRLVAWMEQPGQNPAYGTARRNYAAASTPIDQTKLLNYYVAKLQSPLTGDDTATLRADAFAGARDNGLNEALGNNNIRKATGQQRVRHERELLTHQQVRALEAVQADLARAKEAEQQAKAASQYKGRLGTAATDAKDNAMPSIIAMPAAVLNSIGKVFTNHLNERVADRVGRAMLTPAEAEEMLQNALARERWLNQQSVRIHRAGRAVRNVNRFPAIYNALGAESDTKDKRNALNR